MMPKLITLLLLSSVFFAPVASAQSGEQKSYLCDALKKDDTYKSASGFQYIIAGKDDWLFRTNIDLRSDFLLDEKTKIELKRFQAVLAAKNVILVPVLQPSRGIMATDRLDMSNPYTAEYKVDIAKSNFQQTISDMNAIGFITPDLTGLSKNEAFFNKRDIHWTASGAEAVAKEVAAAMKKSPAFQDIPQKSFETTVTKKQFPFKGGIAEFVEKSCKTTVPDEYADIRETTEKLDKVSNDSLFGEEHPQIVLTGTSNSAVSTANFYGALREHIGADILNAAVSGGGIDTSLLGYLVSPEWKNSPPKFLIWETPAQYSLNSMAFYRQVIPTATGDCTGEQILDETTNRLKNNLEPFENIPDDVRFPQNKNYVHLTLSDDIPKKFVAHIEYSDGTKKKYNLVASDRMTVREIYFEFENKPKRPVTKIYFEASENAKGNVAAKLCSYKE